MGFELVFLFLGGYVVVGEVAGRELVVERV